MRREIQVIELVRGLDIGGVDGGAERFGADLSMALARKGIRVEVCAFYRISTDTETQWHRRLSSIGIPVHFLTTWTGQHRLDKVLKGIKQYYTHRKLYKVHLIHSHTQFGTLAAILTRLTQRNTRIIRTAHVTKEWGNSTSGKLQKMLWGEWLFPIFVDVQVAVSKAVLMNIQKYPGSRLAKRQPILIHNGIPLPNEPIVNLLRRSKAAETYTIGTAARLTEQKGINYLIEAASWVYREIPNIKLLIAGDGELKSSLQQQIMRSGLSNVVFLIGKHPNIYEFLCQLDLFVLPSLWEGLPTAILESMSVGVPVIATNIPGTDELIEDGIDGWLVTPKNAEALAEKIIFALRSPHLRERVAELGLKKAKRFSIDEIADQYLDLFQNVLDS